MQGKNPTEEQMMIQREIPADHLQGRRAEIRRYGAPKAFAGGPDEEIGFDPYAIAVPECLRGYQSMTDNLCYCGSEHVHSHAGADPGPVSGLQSAAHPLRRQAVARSRELRQPAARTAAAQKPREQRFAEDADALCADVAQYRENPEISETAMRRFLPTALLTLLSVLLAGA